MANKSNHSQVRGFAPEYAILAEIETLEVLFGEEEFQQKFPQLAGVRDALFRIHHDKRNGNDTAKRRHAHYKEAGLYRRSNGVTKLQELCAYKQFERSSGFRNTVLMELKRYGIDTDKKTLDKLSETEIDLFAESQSSYYRARTEYDLSFIAPLKPIHKKTKYAAIERIADLMSLNTKHLEREYKLHRESVLMWPRFHAYLKQELDTPPVEIIQPDWNFH